MIDMHIRNKRADVEREMKFHEIMKEIPFLDFPEEFIVQPIPNTGGATVRFRVALKDVPNYSISVYLDCHEELGYYDGKPYWEMYPDVGGDVARFAMKDADKLIAQLKVALNDWKQKNRHLTSPLGQAINGE